MVSAGSSRKKLAFKPILRSNLAYIAAFVLPLIMMLALYCVRGVFPWGDECYLRTDMYYQYAPFFSEFWHKLRCGESLTYSWDIGLGTNFTSLFAYYLASPANWLIVLFPQKYMIEIMNVMIVLKISGSSLAMAFYISRRFNTRTCLAAVFGVFYGMSGFIAAYSWNIMWLDCVILVPLIMLGIERLVNEDKCIFYSITLGLCIFTNYYIAIMVCISVVIYFVVLMILYDGARSVRAYVRKCANFCVFSLLSGGLGACLLLPEFYTFSLSASSDSSFPDKLESYFSVLDMLTRQLINIPVHTGLEHYPNIYCGVAVFLLVPLYIMCTKIRPHEKICKCVILLIFLAAFNLNIPDYIWHGMHIPNSLPARQSFIYIFFLLVMCFEALRNLKDFNNKNLGTALWLAIGLLVIIDKLLDTDSGYSFENVYISGAFILIYALLMFIRNNSRLKFPVILGLTVLIALSECMINMNATGLTTTNRTTYLSDYDGVEAVTETIAENDDSLYRVEKAYGARTMNDGAWHNYHSISAFSSMSNVGLTRLYNYLGIENSTNAYGCNGLTAVTSSLFSVKYALSNRSLVDSNLRSYYTDSDGEYAYINNYTLPIGYAINSDTAWHLKLLTANNGLENQNILIESLTGISDVFYCVAEFPTQIDCFIDVKEDGHMYLTVEDDSANYVKVVINEDTEYNFSNLSDNNRILDIGYVTASDTIEVTSDGSMKMTAYQLDEEKFIEAFDILNSESYQVEEYDETHLSGTVTASEDKVMLFSIPYDAGWTVYVDGEKVSTYSWRKALLCVEISEGTHSIELKYQPVNLTAGCVITALSALVLAAIYVISRHGKSIRKSIRRSPSAKTSRG